MGKPETSESKSWQDIVIDYNVEEDSIYHATKEVTLRFGVPQNIEHAQDYLVRYGVVQPESAKDFSNLFRKIRNGDAHAECVLRARSVQGDRLWAQIMLTTIFDKSGKPVRAVGVIKDVTALREAQLQANNGALHRDIMMREALIYYEANLTQRKVTFGLEQLFETINTPYTSDYSAGLDALTGNIVYPEERAAVQATFSVETLLECYKKGERRVELEYRRLTGNGNVLWVRGSACLSESKESGDIVLCFYVSDINDLKIREISLRERTERDALTGLYNKITAEIHIQESVTRDQTYGRTSALLLVGLNQFQELNERLGHYFGDALLSEVGHKIGAICGETEIAGRNGGVEFLLYLQGIADVEDAVRRAETLCDEVANDVATLVESGASLSVGLALSPEQGDSFETLYRKAGTALATCRRSGGRVCAYREAMREMSHVLPESALHREFAESVVEHVFRTLYESQDLDAAIQGVLEMIADAFGFQRGYVFDVEEDGKAFCVFECHATGVTPMREERVEMDRAQVETCERLLKVDEIYIGRYEAQAEHKAGETPLALRLVYGFRNAGKLCGIVGFNRCGTDTQFHDDQLNSLRNVVRLLGVFLAGRTARKELSESSILLQSIVDGMHTCTYIIEPATHIIRYINQNTQEALPGAQPGRRCHEVLRNRLTACEDCPIDRMIQQGTTEDSSEMYLEQFGVWARVSAKLVTMPSGQVFGVFSSYDFSEQPHEATYNTTLSDFTHDTSLYDALSMSTDDYIVMCDMATRRFYFPKKMVEEFDLPGQVIVDAIPIWGARVHKDDRPDFESDLDAMFSGKTDTHNQEYRAKNKNGEWVWLRAKGHVERSKDGIPTLFAVVLTNLGRKSKVDHLTGLLDKYEFEVSTRAQLAAGVASGVLLLLGLDNFRYINNIYGWDFGDNVLKESSLRLLSTLPEKVQLYRLDGDKFGVFFHDTDVTEVEEYYRSLFHVFRQHRKFDGHRYYCTVSAGCAYFEGSCPNFGTLYKQATFALDASKQDGKNRLTIYDAKTMGGSDRMLALMSALHDSVEKNCTGFEVYYQPQVKPGTYQVQSAEALLRWKNAELGMVSPVEFIPLLEQTGLIHRVGRWVIRQAAAACAIWRKLVPDFTVSVNISFAQIQDQAFLPYLTRQVRSGSIDPQMLHLEITESCIADSSQMLGGIITELRTLGFQIEMDDFGTGYSSLEILKNAPADVVKIDQAFVRDISRSKFDAAFIQIIITLCHSVDIRVCLEGVETWDEYKLIESMKPDLIQGFLFGRPQPEQDFGTNFISPRQTE